MKTQYGVSGECADGYAGVKKAFANNFTAGPEADIGAGCAVTVRGELVVDLWGGSSDLDGSRPWQADTIVNVWSMTKMMTALCVLMLHDQGKLSVDEPMATYWPDFAAAGKADVLVRHVMGHTAGLPVFTEHVDDRMVFDWDACCARLAGQEPQWKPGDGSGYHAETQGWLLGELVRRVDGRTVGNFFREEVAEPQGLDFHLGLPDEHHHRVAAMSTAAVIPPPETPDGIARRQYRSLGLVNTPSWRRSEMPASNGHGNARAAALAMATLANGGVAQAGEQAGSLRLLSAATIERAFEVQADGVDRILGIPLRHGIGYGLNTSDAPLGVNDRTLWWAGWGGSMCVVDVENQMTVAYAMNRMLDDGDLRAVHVIYAAHEAIANEKG